MRGRAHIHQRLACITSNSALLCEHSEAALRLVNPVFLIPFKLFWIHREGITQGRGSSALRVNAIL